MKIKKSALCLQIGAALQGAVLLGYSGFALAAEEDDAAKEKENVEKIAVVGSRAAPRSVSESPVPIDIIGAEEFANQGNPDMLNMLSTLVPSFNINAQAISDAATLIRPANLRGLGPDQTLVLVNGKRRHRASVIALAGGGISDGAQGPDISVIPAVAIRQVEVLRDGAAAQWHVALGEVGDGVAVRERRHRAGRHQHAVAPACGGGPRGRQAAGGEPRRGRRNVQYRRPQRAEEPRRGPRHLCPARRAGATAP